jgi:hypothetical protein
MCGYGGGSSSRAARSRIKEIVRELKVSRNTVRKVLRSGATAFSYEREVQPLPKLGRWRGEFDRMLAANEAKSARERLTLIRLFEGCAVSATKAAMTQCAAMHAPGRGGRQQSVVDAYVPLSFAPGAHTANFDPAALPLAPETILPALAGRFRCTRCGSRETEARPDHSRRC